MMRHDTSKKLRQYEKTEYGFWLYLMTDVILFASLFATYMILRPSVAGGPEASELLNPTYAFVETLLLLASSFTCGIAAVALRFKRTRLSLAMIAMTILLGASFLLMELSEFAHMIGEGHSWRESAFLSAFFTLVGTHGLHITIGLIWAVVMFALIRRRGMTADSLRKFTLFTLFWHFLDIVWIFIFTIVYLGAVI